MKKRRVKDAVQELPEPYKSECQSIIQANGQYADMNNLSVTSCLFYVDISAKNGFTRTINLQDAWEIMCYYNRNNKKYI